MHLVYRRICQLAMFPTCHFVNLLLFKLPISSKYFENLLFCQHTIMPTWYFNAVTQTYTFVVLWLGQFDILSTWHFVNLTFCQLVILSNCYFVKLLFCQIAIFIKPPRQSAVLQSWHLINLTFCPLVMMSFANLCTCSCHSSLSMFLNFFTQLTHRMKQQNFLLLIRKRGHHRKGAKVSATCHFFNNLMF